MDDPGGHDIGSTRPAKTGSPATKAHVDPTSTPPGAGRDDLVTIVDNLNDLAKTFSAQGFTLDRSVASGETDSAAVHHLGAGTGTIIYRYDTIADFALKVLGNTNTMRVMKSADGVSWQPLNVRSAPR